jgi:hypothetical protein
VCPEGWGDRHLLYGHIEDDRQCADCTCGTPSGGFCNVKYTIWGNPGCTSEVSVEFVSNAMNAPCHDFMPGTPLSGKSAEIVEYTSGACTPSGGDVQGKLVLDNPVTIYALNLSAWLHAGMARSASNSRR